MPATARLSKILADRGVASRRAAEKLITDGVVSVDGVPCTELGKRFADDCRVQVNGREVPQSGAPRLWRYHKKPHTMVTDHDPEGRATVFELLPPGLPRLISVGRLDYASQGLLLLTNNGELARYLEHPSSAVPRTYAVTINEPLQADQLDAIADGIRVEGIQYAPIGVRILEPLTVELTLYEGKNREIRRIMAFFGRDVLRLMRVAYGNVRLNGLAPGEIREVKNYNPPQYAQKK